MLPSLCILLSLAIATDAGQVHSNLRHLGAGKGFVRSLEFKHRLRVCNAYPSASALDVYRGKGERLTKDGPMAFKSCEDFLAPLIPGDKLEFKVGDANAGTFAVSDLPNNDAVLLLVIHRHDSLSTAVSFESHVFANLLNAQVAIIDTYKGAARASTRIEDAEGSSKKSRSEDLRFNSVVAVNPGKYEVKLADQNGATKAASELVALNRECYVVIRTGVEAQQGSSFGQELMVYPHSDARLLHSSAVSPKALAALLITAMSMIFVM